MIINDDMAAYIYDQLSPEQRKAFLEQQQGDENFVQQLESLRKDKRIQDFINGELSDKEFYKMEQELTLNEALRKRLEQYELIDRLLLKVTFGQGEMNVDKAFHQETLAIIQEKTLGEDETASIKPAEQKTKTRSLIFWAVAASILLLIGYKYIFPHQTESRIIASDLALINSDFGNLRAVSEAPTKDFIEAEKLYAQENFAQAIPLLESTPLTNAYSTKARFLLANAYLKEQQYSEALKKYDELLQSKTIQEKDILLLNKAVALLGLKEKSEAKAILIKLVDKKNFEEKRIQTQAQKILDFMAT